jgi:hypothetical protein
MSTPTLPPLVGVSPGAQPRRRVRRPSLLAALALLVVVVACVGGGFGARYLMATELPQGDAAPVDAAQHFLTAVFVDHSATEAANFVCLEARDPGDLDQLVREAESVGQGGRTTWPTPDITQNGPQATADATLTFDSDTTSPIVHKIQLQLVRSRGWWVCGVSNAD